MKKILLFTLFVLCSFSLFAAEKKKSKRIVIITDSAKKTATAIADEWDIEALDTARSADYLSKIEKDVVLELNKARSDPRKYAALYISPMVKKFNGNVYNGVLETREGAAVVSECVEYMFKLKGMEPLRIESGLSTAAKTHAVSQGKAGKTGHTRVDGTQFSNALKKYGSSNSIGENISYGEKSARSIVIQLLIDDGVKLRGHRMNILEKNFNCVGVGCSSHKNYGNECVITFAKDWTDK